jgi:hypothetical protein
MGMAMLITGAVASRIGATMKAMTDAKATAQTAFG